MILIPILVSLSKIVALFLCNIIIFFQLLNTQKANQPLGCSIFDPDISKLSANLLSQLLFFLQIIQHLKEVDTQQSHNVIDCINPTQDLQKSQAIVKTRCSLKIYSKPKSLIHDIILFINQ